MCSCWLPKGKFVGIGGLSLGAGSEESLPALTVGPLHSPVSKGHAYKGWSPRPGSTLFLGGGCRVGEALVGAHGTWLGALDSG